MLYQDLAAEMRQKDPSTAEAVRARFLAYLQGPDREYKPPEEAAPVVGADELPAKMDGHRHCKAIIKNLWDLLSQDIDTETIVGQLREFEKQVPLIFSAVIIDELECHDVDRQDQAIKKFAKFWKFTGTKPGELMYQPFTAEFCGRKNYVLHKMIQFLESADPTLRLSCRSWLSQSLQINRILDPIIFEFFSLSNFKKSENQSVTVRGKLDAPNVIENFAKLRLIMNTQDRASGMQEQAQSFDIIDYIIAKPLNDGALLEEFAKMQNRHMHQDGQLSGAHNPEQLRQLYIHKMMFDEHLDEHSVRL